MNKWYILEGVEKEEKAATHSLEEKSKNSIFLACPTLAFIVLTETVTALTEGWSPQARVFFINPKPLLLDSSGSLCFCYMLPSAIVSSTVGNALPKLSCDNSINSHGCQSCYFFLCFAFYVLHFSFSMCSHGSSDHLSKLVKLSIVWVVKWNPSSLNTHQFLKHMGWGCI